MAARVGPGRCAERRVVPECAVFEDLADEVCLVGLDEGDAVHGPAALGAEERVGLIDMLDEGGPTAAIEPEGVEKLQTHERTGRPLGNDAFVAKLERRLQRPLRPRKPGQKRKEVENRCNK